MPLNPNIILNQKLAQPVTAMQQGAQVAQQNRLGELNIGIAENKLASANEPKGWTKEQTGLAQNVLGNLYAEYEQNKDNPEYMATYEQKAESIRQTLGQMGGMDTSRMKGAMSPEHIKMFLEKTGGKTMSTEVQSSRMLPGGLVQITRKDGTVETVTPSEADELAVKAAEDRGASLQGLRAGERDAAKNAQKVSLDAYKDMTSARKNIGTINEAIAALDDGAESGYVASKFPSLTAASVKLDNVRNRLGLNVIGSVTFGALSEAELNMALNTALPTNLQPAELKKWLVDYRNAQIKLSNVLEEAAQYLGTPGNTVASWMKEKGVKGKSGARQQVESKQGGNMPSVSNW